MPAARIIPCLDVRDGRVVKGVRFRDHRDVGDVVESAIRYRTEGADELVFYDITASSEGRALDTGWIRRIAEVIDIPITVAGGLRTRDLAAACLDSGADKISVNSPALERPALIDELARDFGSQCVVLGVDSLEAQGSYRVKQYTGDPHTTRDSGRSTLDWVREAADRGAGEIVLNCMSQDGVGAGFDIGHVRDVVAATTVPVVASGGAGALVHFLHAFEAGASGALAASVFHDRKIGIADLKDYLDQGGIEVRR